MRPSRLLVLLAAVAFTACLNGTESITGGNNGTPIDCETLATSLDASASTLTANATDPTLKYRDLLVGTGATVLTGQQVKVHYSGCLTNGVKFDENNNADSALVFTTGMTPPRVIAGFDLGVIGMKVGGRRQLVIPPALAYGSAGKNIIPPNATLVFTVDMVETQ
jgi:FKBP-type peptidyl-prolyl cis-trans isomerase